MKVFTLCWSTRNREAGATDKRLTLLHEIHDKIKKSTLSSVEFF